MRTLFVKKSRNLIEAEEILLDAAHEKNSDENFERLEFPVSPRLLRFFFLGSIVVIVILAAVAFYYQVPEGRKFLALSEDNRLRALFSEAPRGLILDRFGKILATNQPRFDIYASAVDLPADETARHAIARELGQTLGQLPDSIGASLAAIKSRNQSQAEPLFTDISQEAAINLEAKAQQMPGIEVNARFDRVYPLAGDIANVIGYTGRPTAVELKANSLLMPQDRIGRQGLEEYYNSVLQGSRGETSYEINSKLKILGAKENNPPEPGDNLATTIDADFEQALTGIVQNQLDAAGLTRAGAVAINPQNGQILAMVSLPGFDDNLFSRGISQQAFSSLINSPDRPMFDRPISGEYAPGSTLKPFIAAAALQAGVVTPDTTVDVTVPYIAVPNPFDPSHPTLFHDWEAHGIISMRRALAESSDVYFYTLGGGNGPQKGLGIENIKKYLQDFGFGASTGIDLGNEQTGLIPDPAWKEKNRKSDPIWRIGDTYLTSIGQGDMLATPLQLAMADAAIVNGGNLWQPHLVSEIQNSDGSTKEMIQSKLTRKIDIDPKNLEVVREGMRLAASAGGTAAGLADLPMPVGAKTGTAQVQGIYNTNGLITAFAPYDNPQILIVSVVEGSRGGETSGVPIVHAALSWYWDHRLNPNAPKKQDQNPAPVSRVNFEVVLAK